MRFSLIANAWFCVACLLCLDVPCWAVSFEKDILVIFRAECLSCHNEDDRQGDLDLSTYNAVLDGGASGAVIAPGDPDESLLYQLVAHLNQPSMPPESPMIARESVALIKKWISEGAIKTPSAEPKKVVDDQSIAAIPTPDAARERAPHFPPRLPRSNQLPTINDPAIIALCASPTTPLVAVGGVRQVWLFRTDTNEQIGRIGYWGGDIRCLKFSLDGSVLLVAGGRPGESGSVEVWDLEQARRVLAFEDYLDEVRSIAISSDHKRLAVASTGPRIDLYDLPSGKLLKKLSGHTDWITEMAFSDDGVLLATADRVGGLRLWESWTGELFQTLAGHKQAIASLEWTHDSNHISSAGMDGFIRIWSAESGKESQKIKAHPGGVVRHARIASGGWVSAGKDNILRIWSPQGKSVRAATPFSEMPTAIAYTPVSNMIVVGDYLGQAVNLDANTFEIKQAFLINPKSIDNQITEKRLEHKLYEAGRKKLKAGIKEVKKRLVEAQSQLDIAKSDYTVKVDLVVSLDAQILKVRREVRHINAELSENKHPKTLVTNFYISRKLKKNRLKLLISNMKPAMKQRDEQQEKLLTLRKDVDRHASTHQQLVDRFASITKDAKNSLIGLASLIEESAFSTRYDILQTKILQKNNPGVSALTAGETDGAEKQ